MCLMIKYCLVYDVIGVLCGIVIIGGVIYVIFFISSWDVSNVVSFKGVFVDFEYVID